MTSKVLPTCYNGYCFRSRTEARWAVFFDWLAIRFEYEKDGFDLGEDGWYLPDFWLPQVRLWAEVKGGEFTWGERQKCYALVEMTRTGIILLPGAPRPVNYEVIEWHETDGSMGPSESDVVFGESHRYHLTESRFYSSSGSDIGTDMSEWCPDLVEAVHASRKARFGT